MYIDFYFTFFEFIIYYASCTYLRVSIHYTVKSRACFEYFNIYIE